jgi:hypothetical protein
MYPILLTLHSLFRWVVLVSVLYAIFHSYKGWFTGKLFSKFDDSLRHITATITHIQFMIGVGLYFVSPVIDYFLIISKRQLEKGKSVFSEWNIAP